jgi:hypothetical protein
MQVRLLGDCRHMFCKPCMEAWLDVSNTCPMCRAVLFPKVAEGESVLLSKAVQDVGALVQLWPQKRKEIRRG